MCAPIFVDRGHQCNMRRITGTTIVDFMSATTSTSTSIKKWLWPIVLNFTLLFFIVILWQELPGCSTEALLPTNPHTTDKPKSSTRSYESLICLLCCAVSLSSIGFYVTPAEQQINFHMYYDSIRRGLTLSNATRTLWIGNTRTGDWPMTVRLDDRLDDGQTTG